jgi:hypothetical protein
MSRWFCETWERSTETWATRPPTTSSDKQVNTTAIAAPVESQAQSGVTEKQLVTEEQPKGHSETIAVLAFAPAEAKKDQHQGRAKRSNDSQAPHDTDQ